MKRIGTLIASILLLSAMSSNAQIFWSENFTGGSTGLEVGSFSSTNGAWSLAVTGTEDADPNPWYVSCQEAGQLAGVCGNTCAAAPGLGASLHIGSSLSDGGASYNAGGLCPIICVATNRRATSPTINCTGKYNIRLKFYFILNGQGTTDDGSVYYSPDNGTTWSLLVTPPKTTVCSSMQGEWDTLGVLLPASANNNATVKIGFRWVNNDDGAGSDPSFAVDSVSLRTPVSTGPPSASMTASATSVCEDSSLTFTNTSTGTVDSARWSAPGDSVVAAGATITKIFFKTAGTKTVKLYLYVGGVKVDSASTTITVNRAPTPVITKTGTTYSVPAVYTAYQWYVVAFPPTPIAGATNASYTTTVTGSYAVIVDSAGCKGAAVYFMPGGIQSLSGADNTYWLSQTGSSTMNLHASHNLDEVLYINIYDVTGRRVLSEIWDKGFSTKEISTMALPAGMYIVKLGNAQTSVALKWMKQ